MHVCMYVCMYILYYIFVDLCRYDGTDYMCIYPPTPADGKGERVREERLWTTRNTTTVLGKLK